MNKLLKLTGVSVLAIVAASNANAAGYTCEELIEYTSCNAGYYLTDSGSLCPEGSTYGTGYCDWTDSDPGINISEEDCTGTGVSYIAEVCYEFDDSGAMVVVAEPNYATANTCAECPAGSYCPAGSESPTPCPAGSYCAGTKLGAASGVCAIGSYSLAGATTCTSCPASGLTDANGNVVSVTTESTGSTSSSACFVAKGTLFKDNKGIYKYTDNCEYGNFDSLGDAFYESDNGTCMNGYVYMEAYEGSNGRNDMVISVTGCYKIPDTEEWCNEVEGYWNGDSCECDLEWFGDSTGIYLCTNS